MENTDFWNELCGTNAFKSLGLKEVNEESIRIYDEWYLREMYPYLLKYLLIPNLRDKNVLEIGLGFGTVGEYLFQNSKSYIGVDLSENPVKLMQKRIIWKNKANNAKVTQADALNLPFADSSFDVIVSIGCLHHTGNIERAISEIYRVLKNSGIVIIMLYNKNSYRKLLIPFKYFISKAFLNSNLNYPEYFNSFYDVNSKGEAAPIIQYVTRDDIRTYFYKFSIVKISIENFYKILFIPRKFFLNNLAHKVGLDFYIMATK